MQRGPGGPPLAQHLGGRGDGEFIGPFVDERGRSRGGLGHQLGEARFVGDGDDGDPIGRPEVRDLMGDGPPWRRCLGVPLFGGEIGDQRVEFVALRAKVDHHRIRSRHGARLVLAPGARLPMVACAAKPTQIDDNSGDH